MTKLLVLLTLNWWVLASLPYHPMAPPFIQLLRPQTLATPSPHLSIVHIQTINKISTLPVQNIGKKKSDHVKYLLSTIFKFFWLC